MVPYQRPHRNRVESGLVVSLIFWDIRLQERQVCVCIGPGATWPAPAVVVEGVGTGLVTLYWVSSDVRLVGRVGDWGGAEAMSTFTEPKWSLVV